MLTLEYSYIFKTCYHSNLTCNGGGRPLHKLTIFSRTSGLILSEIKLTKDSRTTCYTNLSKSPKIDSVHREISFTMSKKITYLKQAWKKKKKENKFNTPLHTKLRLLKKTRHSSLQTWRNLEAGRRQTSGQEDKQAALSLEQFPKIRRSWSATLWSSVKLHDAQISFTGSNTSQAPSFLLLRVIH